MARTFVSPMGDPTFSNGVASLAEALFPSAATQARARMMGAQYQGQLANNQQTNLENIALADQNAAWAAGPEGLGMTAEQFGRARLGRDKATPQGIAEMMLKEFELGQRNNAVELATAAGYGVNAPLIGLADGPIKLNTNEGGYQTNTYLPGADFKATSKTVADIAAINALESQRRTAAGLNSANTDLVNDKRLRPERYRSGGGPNDPKPLAAGDSKLISSEILARIPKGVQVSEADLAAAVGLAESLRSQGLPIGTASAQAFDQVFGLDAKPVPVTRQAGITDGPWDWVTGAQVPSGEQRLNRKPAPKPAAPAPAPTPAAAPAAPAAPKPPKVQRIPVSQHQAAVDAANRAIQNGADPEAVRQRLKDMGVTLQE